MWKNLLGLKSFEDWCDNCLPYIRKKNNKPNQTHSKSDFVMPFHLGNENI